MISVYLRGRLGNRLFQYAVARHLSIKNNSSIRFIITECQNKYDVFGYSEIKSLKRFNIKSFSYTTRVLDKIARRLRLPVCERITSVYREKHWGFCPEVLQLADGVFLDGYFQSEKYFEGIANIIRADLKYRKKIRTNEINRYEYLINSLNSVSVHIRRGDYLQSSMHNVCNMAYYCKSMAYLESRLASPHFFLFSDDVEWCHENLNISNGTIVNIQASRNNAIIDFELMRLCKHNIISNSTFSWWAAWLNENPQKVVVAPNRWFNDKDLNTRAMQDTLPEAWIRIDF